MPKFAKCKCPTSVVALAHVLRALALRALRLVQAVLALDGAVADARVRNAPSGIAAELRFGAGAGGATVRVK